MRDIFQKTISRKITIDVDGTDYDVIQPLANVQVAVYVGGTYGTGGQTLATIYQAITGNSQGPTPESGATGGPNPFFTNSSGSAEFYVPTEEYDIVITDTQVPARMSQRVIKRWSAVSAADASFPTDKIAGASNIGQAMLIIADAAEARSLIGTDAAGASRPPSGAAGGGLSGNFPNPGIGNNSVGAAQITDGSVGSAELAAAAVLTSKIADGQVTPIKRSAATYAYVAQTGPTNNTIYNTGLVATITSVGRPVLIIGQGELFNGDSFGSAAVTDVYLESQDAFGQWDVIQGATERLTVPLNNGREAFCLFGLMVPAAGSRSFRLRIHNASSGGSNLDGLNWKIVAAEL